MEIHFLDVGPKKYGDCIFCRHKDQTILIDGGHPGDWKSKEGGSRLSIPEQLEEITGKPGPFALDLLVVTHAHLDHTGCLPKLVEDGTLTAKWALVADEKYGWGRHRNKDGPMDAAAPDAARRLAAALREDMIPDLTDAAAVRDFMDVAAKQEDAYKDMLGQLSKKGTKIVRYGRNSTAALLKAFKSWPLAIPGPTKAHLIKCADAIAVTMSDAVRRATDALKTDAGRTAGADELYISMMKGLPSDAQDSGGSDRPGPALNDMSIVLTLGPPGSKVLLSGDTQYLDPELKGLEEPMAALRAKIKAAGPYVLAKTCHHTSKNAAGAPLFADWGEDVFLVHSGGEEDDPAHPAPSVLDALRERSQTRPGLWARNDRNHLISCFLDADGDMRVEIGSGDLDDFTRNKKKPDEHRPANGPPEEVRAQQVVVKAAGSEHVEVTIRIPHVQTRVTVTVDVSPGQSPAGPPDRSGGGPDELPLPELPATLGRSLPGPLLVATCRSRLAENTGPEAAAQAVAMLREAGATVLDTLPHPSRGFAAVRDAVHAALLAGDFMGVVLLGGPDVVPSAVFDTLDAGLRQSVRELNLPPNMRDPDDFIVWSDHPYGDTAGLDVPVSRVPDGHSATLLLRALAATPAAGPEAFGLRNRFRPFADHVFRRSLRAPADCISSSPAGPLQVTAIQAAAPGVYLMLHGSDDDATVFHGEDEDEEQVPAFDLSCLPAVVPGSVVFAGCCWGALIAEQPALHARSGIPVIPRHAGNSIPLAYLHRGASAFVGCTGVHYSPEEDVPDCFGGPLHAAFWEAIRQGLPPALALFQARVKYLEHLPHGREELFDYAVEYKIYHQFTCLGLGW